MPDVSEQNVLVTGGNRGIGRTIVESFVRQGATVGLLGRREQAVRETIEEIEEAIDPPGQLHPVVADVTRIEDVSEAMEEWIDDVGGIHTLINNAGITRDQILLRMDEDDWRSVLETNLTGAFFCTKSALRSMMRNRWGRVIMVSSVIGLSGNPGQSNYAASKAGMIGFAKSLARELGSRNITINCIAPGYIESDMTDEITEEQRESILESTPLGRLGDQEDVAHCALFLAGEKASFITGEVIRVDGGLAM